MKRTLSNPVPNSQATGDTEGRPDMRGERCDELLRNLENAYAQRRIARRLIGVAALLALCSCLFCAWITLNSFNQRRFLASVGDASSRLVLQGQKDMANTVQRLAPIYLAAFRVELNKGWPAVHKHTKSQFSLLEKKARQIGRRAIRDGQKQRAAQVKAFLASTVPDLAKRQDDHTAAAKRLTRIINSAMERHLGTRLETTKREVLAGIDLWFRIANQRSDSLPLEKRFERHFAAFKQQYGDGFFAPSDLEIREND